jgi:hypothetical protein
MGSVAERTMLITGTAVIPPRSHPPRPGPTVPPVGSIRFPGPPSSPARGMDYESDLRVESMARLCIDAVQSIGTASSAPGSSYPPAPA